MNNLSLLFATLLLLQLTAIAQQDWFEQTSGTIYNLHSVHFAEKDVGWAVGDNGTILKTTNGGDDWFIQTSNTIKSLFKIYCIDSNICWIIGRDNEESLVLKTTSGGENWVHKYISSDSVITSLYFNNNNVGWMVGYKYGFGGIILKTEDGGKSWVRQTLNSGLGLRSVCFVNDSVGWVCGWQDIYKTTNGGEDWNFQYDTNCGDPGLEMLQFTDISIGWTITQGWSPRTGGGGSIWKTSDGGESWSCKYSGGWLSGLPIPRYVHFADNNYGWAIADNLILTSTNGGDDWIEQLNNPLYEPESIHFVDNNTGWAVGGNGLILKYQGVNSIREERIDALPNEFFLSNNFPNPFNPTTTIRYSIPLSTNVTMNAFDILGNEIETLVNKEKQAGTYEITWYAESLPSGIYFYRLQAGGYVETKKMILMK